MCHNEEWNRAKMSSQKKFKKSSRTCSVQGCSKTSFDDVTFHSFPTSNPELLQKWIDFANRNGTPNSFTLGKFSCVCSAHFEPTAYPERYALEMSLMGSTTKRKSLKPDAYPTLDPMHKLSSGVTPANQDASDRKRKLADLHEEVKLYTKRKKNSVAKPRLGVMAP